MRTRLIAATLLTTMMSVGALAACSSTDPGVSAGRSRIGNDTPLITDPPTESTTGNSTEDSTATTTKRTTPDSIPVEDGVIDFGADKPPHDYDGFMVAMFKDVEGFWAKNFPDMYGEPFEPLSGGIFAAYPERTEPIPGCGTRTTSYDDVEMNAFYCSVGDFMAYDDAKLIPELVDNLGQSSVGIVLAHEFGHAVQNRANNWRQPVVLKEQQADCFAGAWAAHISRGENPDFVFTDSEVRAGMVALIQVADPVELSGQGDPNAHGTGFDRVGAFQDGFVGGVERCKTFFTEDRQSKMIDIPFEDARTDPNEGNLPIKDPSGKGSDILTLIPADLTLFWKGLLEAQGKTFTAPAIESYPAKGPYPTCKGVDDKTYKGNAVYCKDNNTIYYDADNAERLTQRIGDMSLGYLLANGFSDAAQVSLGSPLTGERRILADDCLTGAWVADIVPDQTGQAKGGRDLRLSAGDLDEAIQTAIINADATGDTNINGSAFEKIDTFRAGVLGGLAACMERFG